MLSQALGAQTVLRHEVLQHQGTQRLFLSRSAGRSWPEYRQSVGSHACFSHPESESEILLAAGHPQATASACCGT